MPLRQLVYLEECHNLPFAYPNYKTLFKFKKYKLMYQVAELGKNNRLSKAGVTLEAEVSRYWSAREIKGTQTHECNAAVVTNGTLI